MLDVRYAVTKVGDLHVEICSFRARAGRFSFVDLFFQYIDVANHVFVVSVMCVFLKVNPRKRPSSIFHNHNSHFRVRTAYTRL